MKPFKITIDSNLQIIVIPDSEAHMNGHPVLTYSYRLYKNEDRSAIDLDEKESMLHLETESDPNFLGVIAFESPERVFTYLPGQQQLSRNELEELIKQITYYRNSSNMWLI